MSNSAPSGHAKIRQDLGVMTSDLEEYRGQLETGGSALSTCLKRWEEYEDAFGEFSSWLNQTEGRLRKELEPKETLEEKEEQLERYQVSKKNCIHHHIYTSFSCACCEQYLISKS